MRITGIFLVLAAAAFAGCGGGGGGGSADTGIPPGTSGLDTTSPLTQVVILYDVTGDGDPDVLTLDRTKDPMTIVAAVVPTPAGDEDRTDALKGQTIDAEVSRAVSVLLSDSAEVASERRIDVVESGGREVTVTVYE